MTWTCKVRDLADAGRAINELTGCLSAGVTQLCGLYENLVPLYAYGDANY